MIISPQHAWQSSTELACFSKELSLKIQSNLQGHMIIHTDYFLSSWMPHHSLCLIRKWNYYLVDQQDLARKMDLNSHLINIRLQRSSQL